MSRSTNNQQGFTILELLIATMIFSVIFLGVTAAMVQMSKLYYKGVATGRTQETTRSITDRISQQLQFTSDSFSGTVVSPKTVSGTSLNFSAVCIGTARYSYLINAQVNDGVAPGYDVPNSRLAHGLWRDTLPSGASCTPAELEKATPSPNGAEMLGQGMRLSEFDVSCNLANICTVKVGVILGDNDLIEFNAAGLPVKCQTIIGNQWCASSSFGTTILKRVRS